VGAVLAQLEPMLRRLLGAYVRLEVRAGRGLAPVRADPSQVEQLLLNLALNASLLVATISIVALMVWKP